MARSQGYSAQTKIPAASATTVFAGADLPQPTLGRSFVALHVLLAGSGNTLGTGAAASALNRIRVRAGSVLFVDLPTPYLRKYLEANYPSNFLPGATVTQFTIPFYFADQPHADDADRMAAPIGMGLQVDFVYGSAGLTSPTIQVGYTLSDIEPDFYPYIGSGNPQWSGTGNNARHNINEGGDVRGLFLPFGTTGGLVASRWQFVLADDPVIDMPPAMLQTSQEYHDPQAFVNTALSCQYVKIEGMAPAGIGGSSYLLVDVTTGAAAIEEVGFFAVRMQPFKAALRAQQNGGR